MKIIHQLPLLLIFLLAACTPSEEVIPVEEKPILNIIYNSNLETFRPNLEICAAENTKSFFNIRPYFQNSENVDLRIELGEPFELPEFSAQVGTDELTVILHKSNQSEIGFSEIQHIFSGRTINWDQEIELGEIQVWLLPMENIISQIIKNNILGGVLFSSNALIAPGPEQIREAVSSDPAAIGFLPLSWVNSSVEFVDLKIEIPILALADAEPEEGLRDFVVCLQTD